MNVPPFNVYLGTRVSRTAAGEAEAVLDLAPHHLNNRGVVHGGVLSSLLDSALGAAVIAAIPPEAWCATTSLSVQFLEGAREGTLTARGRVLRLGRRVAFAGGEVTDGSGRTVAVAQGSWHLWERKPEGPRPGHVRVRATGEHLRVGKIVAVGRNYADHIREMGGRGAEAPVLFLKPSTALVPGGGRVAIPSDAGSVHHEVELVVAIGVPGRRIPEDRALDHVLGFAVGLDLTLRDLQAEAKKKGEPWAVAKGFDASAPVSEIVSRDEVGDGSGRAIRLTVNGQIRQQASTSDMLHPVAALVAHASRLITLERGDLLFTGTPSGVGPVTAGDRLVAEIEGVGRLEVEVAREDERG